MAGQISIVLRAIDQYSGVVTGLNQGFELMGKALGTIKAVADTAFAAINLGVSGAKRAIDLAALGGAFDEQRNQFENLAKSYGLIGQDIINIVKLTSANTLSEFDSISVATKAIAAGFRGPELETALTYIKRWTEATGQNFESAAERVFTSLSSGRFSVLRQMGLVIENGASFEDVARAMGEGLTRFGDTGFNAADKLKSLTASQDDWTRKIGQAINQSAGFQTVLTSISDAALSFVQSFDARPISVFVDLALNGLKAVFDAVVRNFPQLGGALESFWSFASGGAKGWANIVVDAVFTAVKSLGSGINTALDYLTDSGILSAVEFFAQAIVKTFSLIGRGLVGLFSELSSVALDTLSLITEAAWNLVQTFPTVSETLGIDPRDLAEAKTTFALMARAASNVGQDIEKVIYGIEQSVSSVIGDVAQGARDWRIDLEGVADTHKEINKALDKIDYKPTEEKATNALQKIYDEAGNLIITGELGPGFPEFKQEIGSVADLLGDAVGRAEELDKSLGKKKKVDIEITEKSLREEIKTLVASTDWPTEFHGMMELFLTWILAKASGERVPLAITTTA